MPSASFYRQVRQGLHTSAPLILGYLPLGFTCGVVALTYGLSHGPALFMSVLIYAGSSQLLALQLLAADEPLVSILLTVFTCNLRHLLMSSSLAPHVRRFSRKQRAAFAFGLCDEAFAVHSAQMAERPVPFVEAMTTNTALYLSLIAGTAVAVWSGASATFLRSLGLDYAPIAMFVIMLVMLIEDRLQLATAALCGVLAVGLRQTSAATWSLVLATAIGATLATWQQLRGEQRQARLEPQGTGPEPLQVTPPHPPALPLGEGL
jgi:4-azaleucine resistance transporter AzlC